MSLSSIGTDRQSSGRSLLWTGVVAGVAGLLTPALLQVAPAAASGRPAAVRSVLSGPYGFNAPDAVAAIGNDLFVANRAGNSITEVNAVNGALVRIFSGARYKLNQPTALQSVGEHLYVANGRAGVTEISLAQKISVRTFAGRAYRFSDPVALTTGGISTLYVLSAGGAVTKISVTTGRSLGTASGRAFGFDHPTAIASVGDHLFVSNSASNTVTEIYAPTMKWEATLAGQGYQFATPSGIASHGADLWVTNTTGRSVTEIAAATGDVVQVVPNTSDYLPTPGPITYGNGYLFAASPPGSSPMITQIVPSRPAKMPWMMCNTNGPYLFSNPQALIVIGDNLWVVNQGSQSLRGNSLTEMNTSTGRLIRTIS
ncbi:MAG: NHL repeat-containing protein [Acidimicrobiales bacterium]